MPPNAAGASLGAVPLVLGLDMGGTGTRAVLADLTGTRYGTGHAGPGNPIAHGVPAAARALHTAARMALTTGLTSAAEPGTASPAGTGRRVDPARIRLGLAGMAGGSVWSDPAVRAVFKRAWRDAGPRCPLEVVGDPDVAFAGATPAPAGTVLISGTGAAAARIHDHRLARYTGGHGWLLGDEGGGFWLGREAIRSLLSTLDTGTPASQLTDLVLRELDLKPPAIPDRVIESVNSEPPVRLARFAPLVSQAAETGDPVALSLVSRAADHLVELITRVHPDRGRPAATPSDGGRSGEPAGNGEPVVLAGGVVGAGTATERAVQRRLAELEIGPVLPAGDGAAGAAWLAIRAVRAGSTNQAGPGPGGDGLESAWGRIIG